MATRGSRPYGRPDGRFPYISDEELVLGALLGDVAAFDELVRRYRGAVVAVAEGVLGSRAAAEDVAQEAFLLAFKALPQLEDPSRFGPWIGAIARYRARRVGRQEGRSEPMESPELDRLILRESAELGVHPADALERRDEAARVRRILEALPPDYRIVLELYYFEEWPVRQIAGFLSLPATTVKWRLHYGRQSMRRLLEKEEERNERDGRNAAGDPPHPAHAARNGKARQGCDPDGQPPGRGPACRPAVQPARAAAGADRARPPGDVPAPGGGA